MAQMHLTMRSHAEVGHQWKAATYAGLIAGLVFLVLEMLTAASFLGMSPWAPVRMIGALLLGTGVLPPPDTFDLGVTVAALLVHAVLSVALALVFAALFYRLAMMPAVVVGAVFGLVLYLINFYGFTGIFPWFAEARNWVTALNHILFGAVLAWSYEALGYRKYDMTGHPSEPPASKP